MRYICSLIITASLIIGAAGCGTEVGPTKIQEPDNGFVPLRLGEEKDIYASPLFTSISTLGDEQLQKARVTRSELPTIKMELINIFAAFLKNKKRIGTLPVLNTSLLKDGPHVFFKDIDSTNMAAFAGLAYSSDELRASLRAGAQDYATMVDKPIVFVGTEKEANVVVNISRTEILEFMEQSGIKYAEGIGATIFNFPAISIINKEKIGYYGEDSDKETMINLRSLKHRPAYDFLPSHVGKAVLLAEYRMVMRHEICHRAGFVGGMAGNGGHSLNPRSVLFGKILDSAMEVRSVEASLSPSPDEIVLSDDPSTGTRYIGRTHLTPLEHDSVGRTIRVLQTFF